MSKHASKLSRQLLYQDSMIQTANKMKITSMECIIRILCHSTHIIPIIQERSKITFLQCITNNSVVSTRKVASLPPLLHKDVSPAKGRAQTMKAVTKKITKRVWVSLSLMWRAKTTMIIMMAMLGWVMIRTVVKALEVA